MNRKATVSASSKAKSAKCTEKSDSCDATVSTSVRKWCGAAIYKSKFQKSWKQCWPFITTVPGNPSQFYCNVCSKKLSCEHQGEADVKCHIESAMHTSNDKQLKTNSKLNSLFQPEKQG